MVKYMIVNRRPGWFQGTAVEICDVVEISPEWPDPRSVKNMQGVDVVTAKEFVEQKNDWNENWIPGW